MSCFVQKSLRWLWIAMAYHAVVDFCAPLLNQYVGAGPELGLGTLLVEAVAGVFAIFSLYVTLRLRPQSEPVASEDAPPD